MEYWQLAVGAGFVVASVPMLLNPAKARRNTERAWRSRLEQIRAGAEERFFEERRTLESYPPIKSNFRKWMFGLLLMALGLFSIGIAFTR